jgi:hypothetical protein
MCVGLAVGDVATMRISNWKGVRGSRGLQVRSIAPHRGDGGA